MIDSLLFDLDDTLLDNDNEIFVPAYFDRLVSHFGPGQAGPGFLAQLRASTRDMIANTDPLRGLLSVFEESFYPALGWQAEEWRPRWAEFYRARFDDLAGLTAPRPAARPLMEWALGAGYQAAVATSPLFTADAIQARLRWAGLADLPWARITSLENSHFSKPHPEYLAEVLAHLGRRPDEGLMVGDDWAADMQPAAVLGLPHYWINPAGRPLPPEAAAHGPSLLGAGSLQDFFDWAREHLAGYQPPPRRPRALPFQLSGDLAAMAGALAEVPPAAWAVRPAPGEWSPGEVVCHLRDVELEVNLPRFQAVMESENPFFPAVDTDSWAAERGYASQSGPRAWQDFAAARKQAYTYLAAQQAGAWQRSARHAILGPTRLAELADLVVDHDRLHMAQINSSRRAPDALE